MADWTQDPPGWWPRVVHGLTPLLQKLAIRHALHPDEHLADSGVPVGDMARFLLGHGVAMKWETLNLANLFERVIPHRYGQPNLTADLAGALTRPGPGSGRRGAGGLGVSRGNSGVRHPIQN